MYELKLTITNVPVYAKNLPIRVGQPTVMERQWVAVNSRAWVTTAYCHLEEKE